jgi:argininosuccinate lyase
MCCAPLVAVAADARQTPCKITQECEQEPSRIRGVITQDATSAPTKARDTFYWFGHIDIASTMMLLEKGIIPARLAKPIVGGAQCSITQAREPGGQRPADVMQLERIIFEKAGADAMLILSGRSRQDMGARARVMHSGCAICIRA